MDWFGQNLKQRAFDDGTGSLGLAPGFALSGAYHGSAQAAHPDGSAVVFGLPWAILSAGSSLTALPAAQTTPVARPGDLVGALKEVMTKKVQAQLKSLRVQNAPPSQPGSPAAYFLYDYVQNGRTYRALGYFSALLYSGGSEQWQLYSSAVVAPIEIFSQKLPVMLAMWRSWRPNGQKPKAGSESARFDEAMAKNRDGFEKIQKEFRKLL